MTRRTATFVQAVLEGALGHVVMADPVSISLLERFSAVCLEESPTISLPAEWEDLSRGNGGKARVAACTLFARLDMLRGQLTGRALQDGRRADGNSPLRTVPVPARTFHLREKGLTNVGRWEEEEAQDEWVLTY